MPGRNAFLNALPSDVFGALRPRLRKRELPLGDVLFVDGNKIDLVYFLHAGAISLVTELEGGAMIESAMVGCDSVVGGAAALNHGEAMYTAIVQNPGIASTLDIDTAHQLARASEPFRAALHRHEQLISAQAQQSAACNAAHGLEERLARWLLRVRGVTDSNTFVLTQEFIAEMLGVRRTSVSIIAHTLQQAGIIGYQRGHIEIKKVEALEETACECYRVIKTRYQRLHQAQPQQCSGRNNL
jgi:CRP-like cAMP-binding protein